jgi:methionine sulfoxide reductase heme-binding subunit
MLLARMNRLLQHPLTRPILILLLALPAVWLLWAAIDNRLGPNPAEALLHQTGQWTLRDLLLVLAITPLRRLSGWTALARLRRIVGVSVFVYATLHALCWAWLDMGLDLDAMLRDLPKRPFVWVGALAWLGLMLLAATSFDGAIRWLGGARWRLLHRLVYAIGPLALLHFYWVRSSKNRLSEVLIDAAVLAVLLGVRLRWAGPDRAHIR